jgi:hypothetical protein
MHQTEILSTLSLTKHSSQTILMKGGVISPQVCYSSLHNSAKRSHATQHNDIQLNKTRHIWLYCLSLSLYFSLSLCLSVSLSHCLPSVPACSERSSFIQSVSQHACLYYILPNKHVLYHWGLDSRFQGSILLQKSFN